MALERDSILNRRENRPRQWNFFAVGIRLTRTIVRWFLMTRTMLTRTRLVLLAIALLFITTLRLLIATWRFLLATILLMLLRVRVIRPARDDLRFTLLRKTLRLDPRDIRQDARVMVHMLQVIFYIHAVAVDLRVTRHVAIFAQLLRRMVLLALQVLTVILAATISTTAATIVIVTARTAAAAAAVLVVAAAAIVILAYHVVHKSSVSFSLVFSD